MAATMDSWRGAWSSFSGSKRVSRELDLYALEDRVMLSASPAPVAVDASLEEPVQIESVAQEDAAVGAAAAVPSVDDPSSIADASAVADSGDVPLSQFTTSDGHVLGFGESSIIVAAPSHSLTIELVGANPVDLETRDSPPGIAAAAEFGSVMYADAWSGVTAVYSSQEGAILKSTYYVDAGLDDCAVEQIRLHYNHDVSLDEQGNLIVSYDNGTMTDSAPVAWQEIDGQRQYVDVSYALLGNNEVGFTVGAYDHNYQLVIDPTLTWTTFLGGGGSDYGEAIAVDSSGNVYVAGHSSSTWGSPVRAFSSTDDAFVAKLDSSGNLVWNTFLGGAGNAEQANGIAVDSSGNVYVIGSSNATWGTPVRAYDSSVDAFAAKLDSSGSLIWNTFLGGSSNDYGYGIAVDGSGNVYVGGNSTSSWGAPVRAFTIQGGTSDAFAAKLDSGGALTWNTFLGGGGSDGARGIAVDGVGNVYVGGFSGADWGAPVRAYGGSFDMMAAKLDSSGALTWNTFLGGGGYEIANAMALDASGNLYLVGYGGSTWGSPVQAFTGSYNAAAVKINSAGSLVWNTFLGGSTDYGNGIAVDGSGNVVVTGYSVGTWGTPWRAYTSGNDAFVAQLDSSGSRTWNTFLGDSGSDIGNAVAVDGSGGVFVLGDSNTTWGSPVRSYTSGADVFVAKIAGDSSPGITVTPTSGLTTTEAGGTAQFTVVLDAAPTDSVTVSIASSDTTEGAVSTNTLTFDAGNWSTPQTVTITGVDDVIDEGNVAYTIITGEAVSTDPNYSGMAVADVSVTNADDDTVASIAYESFNYATGVLTGENGGSGWSGSWTLAGSAPTEPDVVSGTLRDASKNLVSANNSARLITTAPGNDSAEYRNLATTLGTSGTTKWMSFLLKTDAVIGPGDYAGITLGGTDDWGLNGLFIGAVDNGKYALELTGGGSTVSAIDSTVVTGDTVLLVVRMDFAAGNDTITLYVNPTPGLAAPDSTSGMSAVNTGIDLGSFTQVALVNGLAVDSSYDEIRFGNSYAEVAPGLIHVTSTSGLLTSESGGSDTFAIELAQAPTADVSIGLSSSDATEGSVAPGSLTFTTSNWATAQTVTVTGAEDASVDGNTVYSVITAAAGSADTTFSGANASNVSVTNVDNDSSDHVPTNSVPGPQSTEEDTPLVFSSASGNPIAISDEAGDVLEVTLTVTNGTLTLSGTSGLSFSSGDGIGDASMTFTGTLENINAALDGLTYNPTADFFGSSMLTLTSADGDYAAITVDTVQKGYYTFDNTASLGADDSGNGNNGTVVGAVADNDPERGQVLNFDGADDYVQISGNYANPASLTFAAWVYADSSDATGEVISLGDNVLLRVENNGAGISGHYYNGADWNITANSSAMSADAWHHVAYVVDDVNDTQTLYVDGVVVASTTYTAPISYSLGADTFLGKHGDGQTAFDFMGKLDDVRIFNTTLSQAEVQSLMMSAPVDTDGVNITVSPVADTPSVTDAATNEDTQTTSGLVVSRNPADGAEVTHFTITGITNGTLYKNDGVTQITNGTFITFTEGNAGLKFTPAADFNGSGSFTVQASTSNNDAGLGGSTVSATITVSAVNDAPVLDNTKSPTLAAENEDSGAPSGAVGTLITSLVDFASPAGQVDNVTDADTGALLGIAVTAADTTNGSWYYSTNNGANWLTLGAVTDGNSRLLAADGNTRLFFQPNANYSGTLAGAVTFRAWDRTSGSNGTLADTTSNGGSTAFSAATDTGSLTITPTNDNPVLDLDADDSAAAGADFVTTFIEDGGPVRVTDVDATLTDADNVNLQSLTVSIVNLLDGSSELLSADITGTNILANHNPGTGVLTLSGPDSVANYQQVLRTIQYENSSHAPDTTARSIRFIANDGTGNSNLATTTTNVVAVNNAPVISAPGTHSTLEDIPLAFSAAGGNAMTISDADASGNPIIVTINATNGSVTLNSTAGLTFGDGDGIDDTAMTFVGTISDVNAALDGMTFQPTANYIGPASLQMTVDDDGYDGMGGPQTDSATVGITITPVNDAPQVADAVFAINEHRPAGAVVGVMSVVDPDVGDSHTYQIVGGNASGAFAINSGTGEITVADPVPLVYESNPQFTLTVQVEDGAGATDTGTATINLINVDGPPTGQSDAYEVEEFSALNISAPGLLTNDIDPDGDALNAVMVSGPSSGQLVLNANGSLTYVPGNGFRGEDNFTYRASDGVEESSSITVTITVTEIAAPADGGADGSQESDNTTDDQETEDRPVELPVGVPRGDANTAKPPSSSEQDVRSSELESTAEDRVSVQSPEISVVDTNSTHASEGDGTSRYARVAKVQITSNPVDKAMHEPDPPADLAATPLLWQRLDSLRDELLKSDNAGSSFDRLLVGSTAAVSAAVTVGYVVWFLRGSWLITTVMSALPAWAQFDPLPVLDNFEPRRDVGRTADDGADDDAVEKGFLHLVSRKRLAKDKALLPR